jgi:Tfp pilus assembly PilM family ATPase
VAEVNRVLDLFANATITDKVRKHTLALELARLDELQEAFYDRL